MKAEHAKMNGGFRFSVALPPYKYKRKDIYLVCEYTLLIWALFIMQVMKGTIIDSIKEVSDNIMEENSFNPYFIKSELLNF